MAKWDKFRAKLMSGKSDANIDFEKLCNYLNHLEFEESIEGSHHKFTREGIQALLQLQPRADGKAKPYQVAQVRAYFEEHGL